MAAEHGAVDDVVLVPKRKRNNLAAEHCGYATLDSQAAWNWLQRWSWGKMSSIAVQQEAFNNYMDYQRMLYKIHLNAKTRGSTDNSHKWIKKMLEQSATNNPPSITNLQPPTFNCKALKHKPREICLERQDGEICVWSMRRCM